MATFPAWVGRYEVREVIGAGGFATVYRATDDRLDADVAVKVLAENHSLEPEIRQRFIEEGRRLRRVRNPHLVAIHELGETDAAQPYLVLDWADRGDLARRVAAARRDGYQPTVQDALLVAEALTSALEVLHRHRLVHRDLAPKNVLLYSVAPGDGPGGLVRDDERVVLADLGLSKDLAVASGLTLATGTSGFAPPEQRRSGEVVGPAADIWAASALLVWLATGAPPDDDGAWRSGVEAAGWPGGVLRVLARGLATRPVARQATISQWCAELREAVAAAAAVPTPVRPRRRWLAVLATALLAVGGLVAVRLLDGDGPTVRTEELDGGQSRTIAEDRGITIELTAPDELEVGESVELTAKVRGADSWVWVGPDGVGYEGGASLQLTPQGAGQASVRLIAFDDTGRPVELRRRLEVSEEK